MAQPRITTVTIDGDKFNALSVTVGISTQPGLTGTPMMGSFQPHIDVVVDIHDDTNMPFATLKKLFELSKVVTKDKIKDMKIEFWKDDNGDDVICTYQLQGWISHFQTQSAGPGNHTLVMSLQPMLDAQNVFVLDMSN
jgi:hypothetical protein